MSPGIGGSNAGRICHGPTRGLGDAHNLYWKIAVALKGQVEETLLDGNESARRPVDRRVPAKRIAGCSFGEPKRSASCLF
ncbi:FAD-dependent monooxygenase [Ensifer sp. 4252]|uniref:FAD-dependent monooxygenase n=1 Tax=Ensifer sp. 4252 TaxID=3373915 RepID=UPI003D2391E9